MLSLRHIERMVESKAYPRLVQRILANGRCESPRAIERLLEPRAVSPAALGLALQRILELAYGPLPLAGQLIRMLLALITSNGEGDNQVIISPSSRRISARAVAGQDSLSPNGSLSAKAVVLGSLLKWGHQADPPRTPEQASLISRVSFAAERGLIELGRQITPESMDTIDPIDAFIIHWQLGELTAAKKRIDFHSLIHRLNRTSDRAMRSYAYAAAA